MSRQGHNFYQTQWDKIIDTQLRGENSVLAPSAVQNIYSITERIVLYDELLH